LLRRFYPGIDPMTLTWESFHGHLERIGEIAEMEAGKRDHRAYVERQARRQRKG